MPITEWETELGSPSSVKRVFRFNFSNLYHVDVLPENCSISGFQTNLELSFERGLEKRLYPRTLNSFESLIVSNFRLFPVGDPNAHALSRYSSNLSNLLNSSTCFISNWRNSDSIKIRPFKYGLKVVGVRNRATEYCYMAVPSFILNFPVQIADNNTDRNFWSQLTPSCV